jgi:hypothetical protein
MIGGRRAGPKVLPGSLIVLCRLVGPALCHELFFLPWS